MADSFWKITFDGQVYREVDLTIGQVKKIEAAANTTWQFINPLRSAVHASAVLSVLMADRLNIDLDDAVAKVNDIRAADFLDSVTVDDADDLPVTYEDGFPPKADAHSTTT